MQMGSSSANCRHAMQSLRELDSALDAQKSNKSLLVRTAVSGRPA